MPHWQICLTIQGYNSPLHSLQSCFYAQKQLFVSFKQYLLKLTGSSQESGVSVKTHHTIILIVLKPVATSFITHVMQTVTGQPFPTSATLWTCCCLSMSPYLYTFFLKSPHIDAFLAQLPPWQSLLRALKQTARRYFAINRLRLKPLVQSSVKQLDNITMKWRNYITKHASPKYCFFHCVSVVFVINKVLCKHTLVCLHRHE